MLVIHLAFILCVLVEAHSQTAPYVSFMGESLPNHSYVDLSLVGGVGSGNDVVCHTDLVSCCSSNQGPHRGDWYFPNGDRLPFNDLFLTEKRHVQRVELYRGGGNGSISSGLYSCDIMTRAVHSVENTARETVYVGLYSTTGGKMNEQSL